MGAKGLVGISIVLKIFTLLFSVGCIVVFVTANFTLDDGTKITFKDLKTYRYNYILLQTYLPLGI